MVYVESSDIVRPQLYSIWLVFKWVWGHRKCQWRCVYLYFENSGKLLYAWMVMMIILEISKQSIASGV